MNVGLIDSCFYPFGNRSASLSDENEGLMPITFTWVPYPLPDGVTFYTDIRLWEAVDQPGRKVAWLIEPPGGERKHYEVARELQDEFELVLTYRREDQQYIHNWGYYPIGGSRIRLRDWNIYPKEKLCSLMVSEKDQMPGQWLRWDVYENWAPELETFGRGFNPVKSKLTALAPYFFSIVIESDSFSAYFTEKLIDCLSCGTVPIYWGCPDIGEFFDTDGIIQFETMGQLDEILTSLSPVDYWSRYDAIRNNFVRAQHYRCTEDWIYRHYRGLFNEN